LGVLTGSAALWLRLGLDETPRFKEAIADVEIARNPVWKGLRTEFPNIARGFGFTLLWTVTYFLFLSFTPTYLTKSSGIGVNLSTSSLIFGIAVFALLIPLAGALSDRVGRKPVLLASAIGFIVLSWPTLAFMGPGNVGVLLGGWVILAVLLAAFSGPGPAALAEMFPTEVRYSSLSIGYNFSVAAFGGTTPLMATALIAATGVATMPAVIVIVAGIVTTGVVLTMKETFGAPLR
jgi:MHS family proline/betaine transporter-like MFS transporter